MISLVVARPGQSSIWIQTKRQKERGTFDPPFLLLVVLV